MCVSKVFLLPSLGLWEAARGRRWEGLCCRTYIYLHFYHFSSLCLSSSLVSLRENKNKNSEFIWTTYGWINRSHRFSYFVRSKCKLADRRINTENALLWLVEHKCDSISAVYLSFSLSFIHSILFFLANNPTASATAYEYTREATDHFIIMIAILIIGTRSMYVVLRTFKRYEHVGGVTSARSQNNSVRLTKLLVERTSTYNGILTHRNGLVLFLSFWFSCFCVGCANCRIS